MTTLKVEAATHAKLSASSAHRWTACPGSVALSEDLPNTSSPAAMLGTAAHELGAQLLVREVDTDAYLGSVVTVEGQEFEVDEEMAEAVQVYLDFVRGLGGRLHIETDLTPALKKLHPDFGGMSDAIAYHEKRKHLDVVDYKHGSGVFVDVNENKQLQYYALGALLSIDKPVSTVGVHIVQPRHHAGEDVRSWEFAATDILDFAADLLEAAEATQKKDAPVVPGESQCKFCPAATICPALEAHTQALVVQDFDEVHLPALSPEKLAAAMDILPMVEGRVKEIRQLAYDRVIKGEQVPGYKLVAKRATRKWENESEADTFVQSRIIDTREYHTTPKLKSVAQVEKLLKKERIELPEGLVNKSSSGYTLVPESDKRPPAQLASPDDFDDIEP